MGISGRWKRCQPSQAPASFGRVSWTEQKQRFGTRSIGRRSPWQLNVACVVDKSKIVLSNRIQAVLIAWQQELFRPDLAPRSLLPAGLNFFASTNPYC
jgi:hypothetical protein